MADEADEFVPLDVKRDILDCQKASATLDRKGHRDAAHAEETHCASFPEAQPLTDPGQPDVEAQPDQANQHDGDDHARDLQIIPFVPDEITNAALGANHFCGDNHEPGDADRDAHSRHDHWDAGGQDDPGDMLEGPKPEPARDVDPFGADTPGPRRRIDQHRPYGADEDDEDGRDAAVAKRVEREWHPG